MYLEMSQLGPLFESKEAQRAGGLDEIIDIDIDLHSNVCRDSFREYFWWL